MKTYKRGRRKKIGGMFGKTILGQSAKTLAREYSKGKTKTVVLNPERSFNDPKSIITGKPTAPDRIYATNMEFGKENYNPNIKPMTYVKPPQKTEDNFVVDLPDNWDDILASGGGTRRRRKKCKNERKRRRTCKHKK